MSEDAHPLNLDRTVAGLVAEYPQVIAVFVRRRMICVGCPLAAFETLADALRNYQIAPQGFVDELHRAIQAG